MEIPEIGIRQINVPEVYIPEIYKPDPVLPVITNLEIDACSDTAALVTLYGATYDKDGNFEKYNMTQYPEDSNS